jgi:hypothetical protein
MRPGAVSRRVASAPRRLFVEALLHRGCVMREGIVSRLFMCPGIFMSRTCSAEDRRIVLIERRLIAITAGLALTALVPAANAQVVSSPETVRACLCLEQMVPTLNAEAQRQRRAYEESQQTFETLDKQVQTSRAAVNVNNPADVDAFKRLLERRDEAAGVLEGPATRSYAEAVQRYNQAVAEYNNNCAGRTFDPTMFGPQQIEEIKRTLSCPKP